MGIMYIPFNICVIKPTVLFGTNGNKKCLFFFFCIGRGDNSVVCLLGTTCLTIVLSCHSHLKAWCFHCPFSDYRF